MTDAGELKGRHLHVDCASGAAGDMMLGALIDLGVPVGVIGDALDAIGAGRDRLRVTRVVKHGIASIDIKVDTGGELAGAQRHVHDQAGAARGDHGYLHTEHGHGEGDHRHDGGDHSHGAVDHSHDGGEHSHGGGEHSHGGGEHSHGGRGLHAHVSRNLLHVHGERGPAHAVRAHAGGEPARPVAAHAHAHALGELGAASPPGTDPPVVAHALGELGAASPPGADHPPVAHALGELGAHSPGAHSPGAHSPGAHSPGAHSPGAHSHGDHSHGDHSHGDHSHDAHGTHDHDAHGPGDHSHGLADHAHGDHAHGDHAHYHYSAIRRRIEAAALTAGTRRRALDIFDRIARAEATLHGKTVDDVAFHEVGAIDSVVDVVGTAAALDWLDPRSVTCTSVAMGHGTITCAHGVLPVPAPAALEILRNAGGIMADGGVARELCTPTGAAILAASVTAWTAAPTGRPIAVGWGAGDAELADRANVLRAIVLEPAARATAAQIWQIDANIDDMSPELCGPASDAVFAAGALDVWWAPITMKKGRPALMISALAEAATRDAVAAAILRETTTIGVRFASRERIVLARSIREVATAYGAIAIKLASDGDAILNAAPEFESCAAAARRHGVPVKLVFAAAQAAFEATRR